MFDKQSAYSLAALMYSERHWNDVEYEKWFIEAEGEELFDKYEGREVIMHPEIFTR